MTHGKWSPGHSCPEGADEAARKPDFTLLIIDPQIPFSIPDIILGRIGDLIEIAKFHERPIIFLQNTAFGDIEQVLLDKVEGYQPQITKQKNTTDGSLQVLEACYQPGFSSNHLLVCGCYTQQCVRDTVVALTSEPEVGRIDIFKGACHHAFEGFDWDNFPRHNKIRKRSILGLLAELQDKIAKP